MIKIGVYRSARGIIKSKHERIELFSIQSGKVTYSRLRSNSNVIKGDTLLIIENISNDKKKKITENKLKEVHNFIKDINDLLLVEKSKSRDFKTPRFISEYNSYQQGLNNHLTKYNKVKRDFIRDSMLYDQKIISKYDFDTALLEYKLSRNNIIQWKHQHYNKWIVILNDFKNDLLELQNTKNQLEESESRYTLLAPIDGTLLGVKSFIKNSFKTVAQ